MSIETLFGYPVVEVSDEESADWIRLEEIRFGPFSDIGKGCTIRVSFLRLAEIGSSGWADG